MCIIGIDIHIRIYISTVNIHVIYFYINCLTVGNM